MKNLIFFIVIAILPLQLFSMDSLWVNNPHTSGINQISFSKSADKIYSGGSDSIFAISDVSNGNTLKRINLKNSINSFDLFNNEFILVAGLSDNKNGILKTITYDLVNDSTLLAIQNFSSAKCYNLNIKVKNLFDTIIAIGYTETHTISNGSRTEPHTSGIVDGNFELRHIKNGLLNDSLKKSLKLDLKTLFRNSKYAINDIKNINNKKLIISDFNFWTYWGGTRDFQEESNSEIIIYNFDNIDSNKIFTRYGYNAGMGEQALDLSITSEKYLACRTNYNKIYIWDLDSYKLINTFPISIDLKKYALSSSGKNLINCYSDGKIYIYNISAGIIVDSVTASPVTAIEVSSDSSFFVTGSTDGKLRMWKSIYISKVFKTHFISSIIKSDSVPVKIKFYDLSTGNPESWFWDFGDGSTSSEQNPIHEYSQYGNYSVRLIITNSGIRDTLDLLDYIDISEHSGVIEFSTKNELYVFNISPNPVHDFLYISGINNQKIEIFSVEGIKVYESINTISKIDVSGFLPGVYFLKVGDKVNKFVKM